jgi:uncharacterized coiled-coil DUF342 family protein
MTELTVEMLREELRPILEAVAKNGVAIAANREGIEANSRGIDELRGELQGVREDVADSRERIRHVEVLVEAVQDDLRALADGLLGQEEKVQAFRRTTDSRFQDHEHRITALEARQAARD